MTLLVGPESGTFACSRTKISDVRSLEEYRESAEPDCTAVSVDTFANIFAELGAGKP